MKAAAAASRASNSLLNRPGRNMKSVVAAALGEGGSVRGGRVLAVGGASGRGRGSSARIALMVVLTGGSPCVNVAGRRL